MKIEATFSILTRSWMISARNPTRSRNRSNLFKFDSFLNGFCMKSYQTTQIEATCSNFTRFSMAFVQIHLPDTHIEATFSILTLFWIVFVRKSYWTTQIEATFSILTHYWIVLYQILPDHANPSNLLNFDPFRNVFVWNPTRKRKSKQPFQFWLVFECVLYEIVSDHVNRSHLFSFASLLSGFYTKSHSTKQIEATFSILTRFWMVFVWKHTRSRKLKQIVQFWLVFQWYLYEIVLDHANWSKLYNFDSFWMIFVWKHTRPRKSKPPFQFWLAFIWYLYEIPLDQANWSNLFNFDKFLNGFCMKAH